MHAVQASGLAAPDGTELSHRHVHRLVLPVPVTGIAATSPDGLDADAREAAPVKKVTVVVRDAATPSKTYVRETSTFDAAT